MVANVMPRLELQPTVTVDDCVSAVRSQRLRASPENSGCATAYSLQVVQRRDEPTEGHSNLWAAITAIGVQQTCKVEVAAVTAHSLSQENC